MLTVTFDLFSASHRQAAVLLLWTWRMKQAADGIYGSMEEAAWPQNQRLRWLAHEPASYMTQCSACNGLHVTESSVGTSLTSSIKTVVWGTLIVDKPLKICLDCWLYTLTVVTVVTTVGMRVEEVQHKLCQHINKWCQVILIARIVAKLLHSIVYQCIIMDIESF